MWCPVRVSGSPHPQLRGHSQACSAWQRHCGGRGPHLVLSHDLHVFPTCDSHMVPTCPLAEQELDNAP